MDTVIDTQPMLASQADERLNSAAREVAILDVTLRPTTPCDFPSRIHSAQHALQQLERALVEMREKNSPVPSPSQIALSELSTEYRHLRFAVMSIMGRQKELARLPRVIQGPQSGVPRIAVAMQRYLHAVDYAFTADSFRRFIEIIQSHEAFTVNELWTAGNFLRFLLLESMIDEARVLLRTQGAGGAALILTELKSLRTITNTEWHTQVEPLLEVNRILLKDIAGAYPAMELTSREIYCKRVAYIARYSDYTELQVAELALELARQSGAIHWENPREQMRRSHVGYYFIDKGFSQLAEKSSFHPPLSFRARQLIRFHADEFYIEGIVLFTVLLTAVLIFPVLAHFSMFLSVLTAIAFVVLPATQTAVDLVNYAVTTLFDPEPMPRLDFSKGIPEAYTTLVAVPSLLLNEKQVRKLAADLEVRHLANRDRNLHFVLLTDLADSFSKPHNQDAHPLIDLAVELINGLNAKYASQGAGGFLLLHRRRQFNVRQDVWMGWERKRGKLLDLNKLLAGEFDAFPIKAGRTDVLRQVRYVLTLDADTQLPRGAAAQLTGTIAHPLNQAILDPKKRIVTAGYGILQPRIGITVQSVARSRLAAIFSGQTGFDIYTHATSDAYQDLFGEGIFTGKGIYEASTLHAVLNNRFPRNALLSHDLIEGSYARAGLISDVELIEDYPSHYSAYCRRQHRWVRGDWQIARWIFKHVPNEQGRMTLNPVSTINRWKIFDNLRRSLVDPALFSLFVAAWLGLPGGALYWTLAPIVLLLLPLTMQLIFNLTHGWTSGRKGSLVEAFSDFGGTLLIALFRVVLLPHTTLLVCDAVIRSLIRSLITGKRLLEWETADQAESLTRGRAPTDRYLVLAPLLPICLAVALWLFVPQYSTLLCAAPLLLLWLLGVPATSWLNRTPRRNRRPRVKDEEFLLGHALRTWRYFHQFSTERHHFLIPDNVAEDGLVEAARVSPTNIGLLLNARQAAHQLGFLTAPEFVELTSRSLGTIARLEKFRGHLYNWYDTETLKTLGSSPFVSSVDSGNFAASLYTLHAGALEIAKKSLLGQKLFAGFATFWKLLCAEAGSSTGLAKAPIPSRAATRDQWIKWLTIAEDALKSAMAAYPASGSSAWLLAETRTRVGRIQSLIRDYMPWTLPDYLLLRALRELGLDDDAGTLSLEDAIVFAEALKIRLSQVGNSIGVAPEMITLSRELHALLTPAIHRMNTLLGNLRDIAHSAVKLAGEMEFAFLVDPGRQILSIGYDMQRQRVHEACYDMMASEARIATFLAIARGDLPRQSWLKLARDHVHAYGRFVLLSWSGTMFEYLMPSLWMRSYQGTLLANTQTAVVRVQDGFASEMRLPWGISESGAARKNDAGDYHYQAYGIPQLSLWHEANAGPIISPYSTLLALSIDGPTALHNLRKMDSAKWVGAFGFYEAADYTESRRKPTLVREWMAHHQGMSLLAIVNALHSNVVQQWFHANPAVQATELLLHEKLPRQSYLRSKLKEFAPLGSY